MRSLVMERPQPAPARLDLAIINGRERGVALIEALVAIVVFAIGVLALVGLQARSVGDVSESRYRSEAAYLANQLIAQIMTDPQNIANYVTPGALTVNSRLQPWVNDVVNRLPGASAYPPIVAVVPGTPIPWPPQPGTFLTPSTVTVTVRWAPPGTRPGATATHTFVATSVISRNPSN